MNESWGGELGFAYRLIPNWKTDTTLAYTWGKNSSGGQPHRFNELRRQVDGISQPTLTCTLMVLERDGLVARTVLGSSPPRVEYALTPFGFSLAEKVHQLENWALGHVDIL